MRHPVQLTRRVSLHLSWTLFCFFFLFLAASTAGAFTQNTAFLPLKTIAPPTNSALPGQLDALLRKNLADQGLQMVSRDQAAGLADYQGAWPPPQEALNTIAEATGYDYVATGSLTVIGGQFSLDMKVYDVLSPATPHSSFHTGNVPSGLDNAIHKAVADILAFTNRSSIISSLVPAGNTLIDSGAILRKIKTKAGDAYNPSALRADLKNIFSMGYFDDVQIETKDTPQGKEITFRLKEKPVISSVHISGTDQLDEEEVTEAANITKGGILNPSKIKNAAEGIRALYKSKGYYNTTVATKLNYPSEDQAEIRFVIDEGKKIYIKQISFSGNKTFSSDDLEDVIQTNTKGIFSWITESGVLDTAILKQDAARLGAYYHNHGFLEAKIGEPRVEQKEEWLHLTFPVEEGPRYKVGSVTFSGDLVVDKDEILGLLKIRDQEYLSRKILREDILRIIDLYAEKGYAFAEAKPKIDKAESGKRVDVDIAISKGKLAYFNRVEIRGNSRTRDNVIRRELTIEEGGVFDSRAIRTSTKNLQRLDFFEEVNITPKPSLDENRMDVLVEVKEKPTGQFSIGGGYSSAEKLLFMAEIKENNLLGRGDKLSLQANLSSVSTRFNINYTDPRFKDSQLSVGFDVFNWKREYDDYTKDSKGGALRFGHPFIEKWRIYWGYSYTDTTLEDVSENASFIIQESQKIKTTSALKLALVRDTRDSRVAASRGSRQSISVKYAGGFLGGDSEFTKVEGTTSWFFQLPWDTVFHIKASAGQAFENEDDKLPVYERFYIGGLNSIRGFKWGNISPRDAVTNERIGGDKMWYANIEYIFPLLKDAGLRGVIFADIGNSYFDDDDWDFSNTKKSAGIGFRWLSPMGPLRLEWGYNLDRQDDEESSVWDFSIGGVF